MAILTANQCLLQILDILTARYQNRTKKNKNITWSLLFKWVALGCGNRPHLLGSSAVWDWSHLKGKIWVIRNHGSAQRLLNHEWVNFPCWREKSTVGAVNAEAFIFPCDADSWRLSRLRSNSLSSRHWTLFPFCLFFPLSLFHTRRQLLCPTWRP